MSLPSTILDPSRYCTGKADFAIFKEEFMLGLESVGLADIVTGVQTEPLTEPTFTTIVETRDSSGQITGTTSTIRELASTPLGSAHPTKADYKVRERKANLYIMTHIIDSKAIGCDPTKTAAENWKVVLAKYGTTSAVEQVMARERLTGLRLIPVHEDANEFTNHVATFKALLRSAIAAGNKFEDGVLKNMFMESIDSDLYLEAASSVPITSSIDETIATLMNTWWIRHRRCLQEIQQAALVTAMMAKLVLEFEEIVALGPVPMGTMVHQDAENR
ncbi:hypothetical protein C8J56DRAFT_885602 [Mycena floridula]|nr:hypothetical protein C8J56DRAFT_885602 [Mycena floridula]